jgi:hypothetical protein
MPWIIENGTPIRSTVRQTISPPEVTITTEITLDDLACPECDKSYKTERGLEAHIAHKH